MCQTHPRYPATHDQTIVFGHLSASHPRTHRKQSSPGTVASNYHGCAIGFSHKRETLLKSKCQVQIGENNQPQRGP